MVAWTGFLKAEVPKYMEISNVRPPTELQKAHTVRHGPLTFLGNSDKS
jgi:hypothetical protein